jgi:hypothetical protein
MCKIFNASGAQVAHLLADDEGIAKLAYLLDIFVQLDEPNRKMQGKNENILIIMDNVQGFSVMLKL